MKIDEIRDLSDAELEERIRELKQERFRLGFRSATMELENPSLMRTLRREIAQLKTVLHERQMAGSGVES
ncbi:MAG: 50S ribosomal protein L29 [Gemmatimonadetes bacterium]|nr:50S ribosomal protein L29 [Gemmatimonadota bacterium]